MVVEVEKTRENASANALYNTSRNSYETVLDFLEGRPLGDEYWCPKEIARVLNREHGYKIAESTVRGVLKRLRAENKVHCLEKGKIHLYASNKRFTSDFNYLFKNFGVRDKNNQRYQIHGLHLQLTAKSLGLESFENVLPLGGAGLGGGGCVRVSVDLAGGVTSVQLYRGVLVVQVNCSGCPLDLDGFVAWLAGLDGWLVAKGYPRVEGNLERWMVMQYGLNVDFLRVNVDRAPVAVSLLGFKRWLYRVYDKVLDDGRCVVRSEVHGVGGEGFGVEAFLSLASGSMSYVQVMNMVQATAFQLDNAVARIGGLERAVAALARSVDRLVSNQQR